MEMEYEEEEDPDKVSSQDTTKIGKKTQDTEKNVNIPPEPVPAAPPLIGKKTYCNLHITIKAIKKGASITDGTKAISIACKAFMKEMQAITNSSFKLHSWDPNTAEQTTLHRLSKFSDNLPVMELKQFFKGAHPISNRGKAYLKIYWSPSQSLLQITSSKKSSGIF